MPAQQVKPQDVYPLTPLQQGILFHSLAAPRQGVYVQQLVCDFEEPLDAPVFVRAWDELARRHAVLRTSFDWQERNTPAQVVRETAGIAWQQEDWRDCTEAEQEARREAFLRADRQRGFDLATPPLFRLALHRLGEAHYQLIWTSHHILLDGRSRLILLEELFEIYEALAGGRTPRLPPARPFRSFVDWLATQDFEKATPFWRDLLAGHDTPTVVEFGARHKGEPGFARRSRRLPAALSARLRLLSAEEGLTLNTLLQGAWAMLLSRYGGQRKVIFGATRAGRASGPPENKEAVGLLINTVPVAVDVDPSARPLPWLRELRSLWVAMRPYEHTPLVRMRKCSRLAAGVPLFESLVVFEDYQLTDRLRERGGQWRRRTFHLRGETNYPIVVTGYDGDEILLEIEYDAERFAHQAIERLLRHLQTLLTGFADRSGESLSRLPLLTQAEQRQVLVEWNNTATDYAREKCVHELFEEQTERTPDAPAVVFEDRQLTYAELNARSNQLADYLRGLGACAEKRVGLCVGRSPEMAVALLGILKSGAAYVPLDASDPRGRLTDMLDDSGVSAVVTQGRLVPEIPQHAGRTVCIDLDWEEIARGSRENVRGGAAADNLAYVMFTSGSTGRPKGVAMPHRPLVNLLCWHRSHPRLGKPARTLQFAPITFDVSFQDMVATWCTGGTVVLVREDTRRDPIALLEYLEAMGIERLYVPFVALQQLAEAFDDGRHHLDRLLDIVSAGEALRLTDAVRALLRHLPWCQLHNHYGPTECHVVTAETLTEDPRAWPAEAPIGRPVANAQIYLLDGDRQPVPVDVPGEVYIGGDCVSRGYWNRFELTAEKYVEHPYSSRPGARLYRTGDLARYLPDGKIEFLRRLDDQVKIRGFRVELGEIESVLRQNPLTSDCAVLARQDGPGEKRLVAYIIAKDGRQVSVAGLRSWLRSRLPGYMVPSVFVFLDRLPLTPSGKVDRKALPAPEPSPQVGETARELPRTPLEETLALIWEDVLGIGQVGVDDDFFELGGHSLLVTQVVSRIRQALEVELPVRDLFEAPTIARLAKRVAAAREVDAPPLQPVSRAEPLPLSFAQQRLWFLDEVEPGNVAYAMPQAYRLTGPLEVGALERSLGEILRRHEALRTTFQVREGQPVQVITPPGAFTLPVVDLSARSGEGQEAEVQRLVAEHIRAPFDLAAGPLWRGRLLRLGAGDHLLLMSVHHVVFDGWSRGVFLQELSALYAAFREGRPGELPEIPVQYADYAVWQRQWFEQGALEPQLAYWRKQLADVPTLEMPTDRPRPARQSYAGGRYVFELSREVGVKLGAFNRRESVTPFMSLLAAFQVLLSRYSGQEDIVVGTPIANRQRAELENLIGFFVNTLVMRGDLSGAPTYREVVARVRRAALEAYQHQDLPFEKLVEELKPVRDLSRHPLFQVLFALQSAPRHALELGEVEASPYPLPTETSHFDLQLHLWEEGEVWVGSWLYNTDLFDAETIQRMAGHYRTLLEHLLAEPDVSVARVPLMPAAERRQLLVEWNQTRREYPRACVHELFERQAEEQPEATAVVLEGEQLTYRELNERANRLARLLRRRGVEPDVPVGIYLPQSLEMLVAVLGILKAGGAYVPLSRTYPRERLRFMVEDSRVPILLTHGAVAEELPVPGAHVIHLDSDWGEIARESAEGLASTAGLEDLLYVLYTSGSTGRPKGIALPHRAGVNLIRWQLRNSHSPPRARTLLFSPLSFDASFTDMFMAWCSGGTLVVATDDARLDPHRLAALLRAQAVERINLPYVALNALASSEAASGKPMALPALKEVLSTAEQLQITPELREWFRRHPGARLQNQYGPTETHVATALNLSGPPESWPTLPTIGRPIDNTRIYILDRQGEPAPVGVVGDLYLAGDGLARGYLHQPELTADKFIPDPFSAASGDRMYQTGDLARWRADGTIEFLGRADRLIKIRGYRVEPGEVETVARQHPGIKEVVVALWEKAPGDQRLVGYVIPTEKEACSSRELQEHLRQHLPEYMVPSVFVFLDRLPLTPSGKVDRKALPAPQLSREAVEAAWILPRAGLEKKLAEIWEAVLKIERVGAHDNFFELGGHSLLGVRVISRIREEFKVELPLRDLFEAPTIARLAKRVGAARKVDAPPLRPVSRAEPLPLSFAQQRLWFLDWMEPGSPLYNIPWATRLSGALDAAALRAALEALVARHEVLRTVYANTPGGPVQVVAPEQTVDLAELDVSAVPGGGGEEEALRLLQREARRPFDLARDVMLRAMLVRLSEREHMLLLTLHHIAGDAWSMRVISRELREFYTAFSGAREPALAELPIQYADFAAWQRGWLTGETFERQLAYWKQQLAGSSVLQLPTDHPRTVVQTHRGAQQKMALAESLVKQLRRLAREEGATLFMTLLAAFQVLLHRYSGQDDILVGTPIAERTRHETHELIGFFVNTLVLRSDFSDDPSFRQLLGRLRETALDAYHHQDIPFEKLVEVLQPERSLNTTPLFQVMFGFEEDSGEQFGLPGLSSRAVEVETGTSKFDLTLTLGEKDGRIPGVATYRSDLFDDSTARQMLRHFQALLEAAITKPDCPVSRLPMLSEAERRQVLVEWNGERREYPRTSIHELFEEQAARQPEVAAVLFEGREITYRALDRRANQLANYLRRMGVGVDTLVGVCLERSLELVVALYGVLKAGAAFVPIDPEYPPERVAFMLQDANAPVLLTESRLLNRMPSRNGTAICLDTGWGRIADESAANPIAATCPDNLAYVIYTSGSTGKPKGAMNTHRGICNRLLWMQEQYRLTERDRILQKTPFGFDVSVWEFFWPLLAGARLVVAKPGGHRDPSYLVKLIKDEQITVLHFVPPMLQVFLEEPGVEECLSLRHVVCSGEALPYELQERFFSLLPAQLHNLYGPAEAAVDVTHWTCQRSSPRKMVPIGRPVANTQVYVLDKHLQPNPIGVPGELYIGGVQVGRGYHNRAELTAEKFIPDPFRNDLGGRLYKTGDLCRWLPDGNIEFLGRIDDQLKIRGFRIEPGEIEVALAQHANVERALVTARGSPTGDRRLVAYVIAKDGGQVSVAELRSWLRGRLPGHMVPAAFVYVETLPLMANGKIDWAALPEPDFAQQVSQTACIPARTPLEEALAGIWRDVLGIEQVGVHDNFFDLGGHSLLAVTLLSRIRERLGGEVPMAALYREPTIAGFARALLPTAGEGRPSPVVAVKRGCATPPFYCVHPGGGQVLRYVPLTRHLDASESFYGLEHPGIHDPGAADLSIEELSRCYVEAVRERQPQGPYLLGGWSLGGLIAYEMAQQLWACGQPVALLALIDTVAPTDRAYAASLDSTTRLGRFLRVHGLPEDAVTQCVDAWGQGDDQGLVRVHTCARKGGWLPAGLSRDQFQRLFDLYSHSMEASRLYVSRPDYPGWITLFRRSEGLSPDERAGGWDRLASAGLEVHDVPGDHDSMLQEPHVATLAARLQACLTAARSGLSGAGGPHPSRHGRAVGGR